MRDLTGLSAALILSPEREKLAEIAHENNLVYQSTLKLKGFQIYQYTRSQSEPNRTFRITLKFLILACTWTSPTSRLFASQTTIGKSGYLPKIAGYEKAKTQRVLNLIKMSFFPHRKKKPDPKK